MKLIFIHGRSQQGKDPLQLHQEWEDALKKGLKRAGLHLPTGTEIIFPFYGDRLDELIEELETPQVEHVLFRGVDLDSAEVAFQGELLYEMAHGAGISDQEIQAFYKGNPHEKGLQNWEWVQAILKALDKTPFGTSAIDIFTRDVYVYLTNKTVRKTIDRIVSDSLTDGPCVVVGHSLGSVVGYNVLRTIHTKVEVNKYVTVGSPLGLKAIKKHLESPLAMPACAKKWFNAMDERDVVALYPLDNSNFNIFPSIKNKTDVNNHTSNRHGVSGYLDDPEVAQQIYVSLAGAECGGGD